MKILFVNTYAPARVQWGVETVLHSLMQGLRKKGVECDLVSLSDRELMLIEATRFREKFLINALLLAKLLPKLSRYDLVHFNAYNSFIAKFIRSRPKVVTLHGTSFGLHEKVAHAMSAHRRAYSRGVIERMERIGSRACDRVAVVSESVRDQAIRGYGIPSSKIRIVHNGVSLSGRCEPKVALRKALGLDQSAPLLITVTRGDYTKGTDMLVKICERMHGEHGARLLVIGHIPHNMRRGWMDFASPAHSEIWKYYQASDVYLNTSRYEGFGLAMLEAMGYGVPAVSFEVGIAPEAIEGGKNGFLTVPFEVNDYAEKTSRLLGDEKLRKRMGTRAAETVKKKFLASKMAAGYLELYKELLSKRR